MLSLMLFDLCKDFLLFHQDQGIIYLTSMPSLSLGPGTNLGAGHCPSASHTLESKTVSCCCGGRGKHDPWENSEAQIHVCFKCLFLMQDLCKNQYPLSNSGVPQPLCKVTQWQKVTEVFYQPSSSQSITPLPGLVVGGVHIHSSLFCYLRYYCQV